VLAGDEEGERYRLEWAGKRLVFEEIAKRTSCTLTPDMKRSREFDTSKNVFIEGENLEVLRALQKAYFNKVKMIYIDPPYNTGKDFVYNDNFRQTEAEYCEDTCNVDENGLLKRAFKQNSKDNGRYHSNWLSMMYPRLYLARNLLRDDGVIFVSIDDNEVHNLRMIMNEIFGEENFVGQIVWKNVTDNNPSNVAIEHEYILVFAKSKTNIEPVWKSKLSDVKDILISKGDELIGDYPDSELRQKEYTEWFRENKNQLWPLENYKFIDDTGIYSGERGIHNPGKEGYRYDVIHPKTKKPCKQPLLGYRFPEETINKMIAEGRIIFGEDENKLVEIKVYAKDYQQKLSSVINLDGRAGTNKFKELFPEAGTIFTNPKLPQLIETLISFACTNDDLVLDFFAGSGTTAHAVMALNAEDGGNRKYICVQMPEETPSDSEASKAGYKTISDITVARIEKAAAKIKTEHPEFTGDLGVRVYKQTDSNFPQWHARAFPSADELGTEMIDYTKRVTGGDEKARATEVLLKIGYDLTTSLQEKDGFLLADGGIALVLVDTFKVKDLGKVFDAKPTTVIILESLFKNDDDKINFALRCKEAKIIFQTI
jgi:adenine-specific DNA-methyltransferase